MKVKIDFNKLITGIKTCLKLKEYEGTYTFYIARDIEYHDGRVDVALVYTYSNEDEEVLVKLVHQPSNSIMQCDYDIDWQYPFCENCYTEIGVNETSDIKTQVEWCLGWLEEYGLVLED